MQDRQQSAAQRLPQQDWQHPSLEKLRHFSAGSRPANQNQLQPQQQNYHQHQHQASLLNLSGDDYEHLPTDGTFAPNSASIQIQMQQLSNEWAQNKDAQTIPTTSLTASIQAKNKIKQQTSEQNNAPTSLYTSQTGSCSQQRQNIEISKTNTYPLAASRMPHHIQTGGQNSFIQVESRGHQDGATSQYHTFATESNRTMPTEIVQESLLTTTQSRNTADIQQVDVEANETMTRDLQQKERWINMPLTSQPNSNRTQRSYFIVSKQQQHKRTQQTQQPQQQQQQVQQLQQVVQANNVANSSARRHNKNEPQFTSMTDIPADMNLNNDRRATVMTPHLGSINHDEAEHVKLQQQPDLISTHQLLTMTASPIACGSNETASQKQTQRSIKYQTIQQCDRFMEEHKLSSGQNARTRNRIQKASSQQNQGELQHSATMQSYASNPHQNARMEVANNELSVLPGSKHGAALKEANSKTSHDFNSKIGHLKQALSTIKTKLSTFKNSNSAQNLTHQQAQVQTKSQGRSNSHNSIAPNSRTPDSRHQAVDSRQFDRQQEVQQQTFDSRSNNQTYDSRRNFDYTINRCDENVANPDSRRPSQQVFTELTAVVPSDKNCYNGHPQSVPVSQQQSYSNMIPYDFSELNEPSSHEKDLQNRKLVTAVEETLSRMYKSTTQQFQYYQDTIETGRDTGRNQQISYRQKTQEATGKFVNPNQTAPMPSQQQYYGGEVLSSHRETSQSEETIEQVHQRHQNSQLNLEQSNRQLHKHHHKKNSTITFDMERLNFSKLDESKSVPQIQTMAQIQHKHLAPIGTHRYSSRKQSYQDRGSIIDDQRSNHQSCKHQQIMSEEKCHYCCQAQPQQSNYEYQNINLHDRSQSTPALQQNKYHTSRNILQPINLTTTYNMSQRRFTEDTVVKSTNSMNKLDDNTSEPYISQGQSARQAQHQIINRNQSSRDMRPDGQNNGTFARSISTPIIVPAGGAIDIREQMQASIETKDINYHQRIDERSSEGYSDNKDAIEPAANLYPPKVVLIKRKAGSIVHNKTRQYSRDYAIDVPSRESTSVKKFQFTNTKTEMKDIDKDRARDDSKLQQMQALKKELDALQVSPAEFKKLKKLVEQAEVEKRRLEVLVFKTQRNNKELEGQAKLLLKENSILKTQANSKTAALKQKDQDILALENQVHSLRKSARSKQMSLQNENNKLVQEIKSTQNLIKQQEMNTDQLRNQLTKKHSSHTNFGQVVQSQVSQRTTGSDGQTESSFIANLLKMIGADQEQASFEQVIRKLKKQNKFTQKIVRMISEVEGRKIQSLTDCIKWIKNLLKDFITLRSKVQLQQDNSLLLLDDHGQNKSNSRQRPERYLSPIDQNSHFSLLVDSVGGLRGDMINNNNRNLAAADRTVISSNNFSPDLNNKSADVMRFMLSNNTSMNASNANIVNNRTNQHHYTTTGQNFQNKSKSGLSNDSRQQNNNSRSQTIIGPQTSQKMMTHESHKGSNHYVVSNRGNQTLQSHHENNLNKISQTNAVSQSRIQQQSSVGSFQLNQDTHHTLQQQKAAPQVYQEHTASSNERQNQQKNNNNILIDQNNGDNERRKSKNNRSSERMRKSRKQLNKQQMIDQPQIVSSVNAISPNVVENSNQHQYTNNNRIVRLQPNSIVTVAEDTINTSSNQNMVQQQQQTTTNSSVDQFEYENQIRHNGSKRSKRHKQSRQKRQPKQQQSTTLQQQQQQIHQQNIYEDVTEEDSNQLVLSRHDDAEQPEGAFNQVVLLSARGRQSSLQHEKVQEHQQQQASSFHHLKANQHQRANHSQVIQSTMQNTAANNTTPYTDSSIHAFDSNPSQYQQIIEQQQKHNKHKQRPSNISMAHVNKKSQQFYDLTASSNNKHHHQAAISQGKSSTTLSHKGGFPLTQSRVMSQDDHVNNQQYDVDQKNNTGKVIVYETIQPSNEWSRRITIEPKSTNPNTLQNTNELYPLSSMQLYRRRSNEILQ